MSSNISCRVTARLSPTLKERKSTCDGIGRPYGILASAALPV
jgi:hypothetical protein